MKQLMTDGELSVFSGQLAMILHSGISTLEGIEILKEDAVSKEAGEILGSINEALEQTGDLAEAFRTSGVFPEYFIKMTEIGERSGTLEDVMDGLSSYYSRQDSLARSIRDALTYPLILLAMLFSVLLVLMTQVMPVFREVFDQLGIELTGVSGTVFAVSSFLQHGSAVLLVLVIGLAAACFFALRPDRGRAFIQKLAAHIPLVVKIRGLLSCSRFADTLSLALHSGLDMGESFELAAGLADQPEFTDRLTQAKAQMDEGIDMAQALRDCGIFTGMNARMVSIGFRTGSAEDALKKIAVDSQAMADDRIQSAIGALEPTLTAILSILTGLILISVMLPLLGVMANIG